MPTGSKSFPVGRSAQNLAMPAIASASITGCGHNRASIDWNWRYHAVRILPPREGPTHAARKLQRLEPTSTRSVQMGQ